MVACSHDEMNEEIESQGSRDLKQAAQWCLLAWACILLGGALGVLFHDSIIASIGGGILMLSGLIFSAISTFLSALGILFPSGVSRLRFVLVLALSCAPYLSMSFWFLV